MRALKKVKVENAVGMVLPHDITRIIPGKFKGVGFKKGHIVQKKDIPELLKLGKQHLYVLNLSEAYLHEDAAALRIARAVSGKTLRWTDPCEGKTNLIAETDGVLKINIAGLLKINRLGSIIISTLKNNFPCRAGQTVAATRIIPLIIRKTKIERLETIAEKYNTLLDILPYQKKKVGAVVTGSELYEGLITDEFDTYVGSKISSLGSAVVQKILAPDDPERIAEAVRKLRARGCDLIVTTGGLSVDPDDVTRIGIQRAGAKIQFYGTPILPGAMYLYAHLDGIPIMGLPACVYYHSVTIFDLMLPRVLAGETITNNDLAAMGHGGLCMNCRECRYPVCPFGK
ncbi:MAG: molybdopterin-binding protein [Thermodesulfobacteriota bacterium]